MSKFQGKGRALSKKNTQREFNNISTDELPKSLGAVIGGILGSGGGITGIIQGAKSGMSKADELANKVGWGNFNTPMYIPMTESQAQAKYARKK